MEAAVVVAAVAGTQKEPPDAAAVAVEQAGLRTGLPGLGLRKDRPWSNAILQIKGMFLFCGER